jgi:hypothetical protein
MTAVLAVLALWGSPSPCIDEMLCQPPPLSTGCVYLVDNQIWLCPPEFEIPSWP